MRERFFGKLIRGTFPLLVWATHFAGSYVLVAAQCSPAATGTAAPGSPHRLPLALMTIVALAICAALAWRARRTLGGGDEDTALLDWAAALTALLAFAGIAWTSVPLWFVDSCS
jgi:cytochrome c oxidase assembly factor CtaG